MTSEESVSDDTNHDSSGGNPSLGEDATQRLFELLSVRRRRYLLYYLQRASDEAVSLEDAVEQVGAWERETGARFDSEDAHRHDVAISFHHVHIPKLVEAGAIEYDERSQTIRYSGSAAVERCLETIDDPIPE